MSSLRPPRPPRPPRLLLSAGPPRRRAAAAALALVLVAAAPQTAAARIFGASRGYGYGGGWGAPSHIEARGHTYDLGLAGLEALCAGEPDLCDDTAQARLQGLGRRQVAAWATFGGATLGGLALSGVGLALLLGGGHEGGLGGGALALTTGGLGLVALAPLGLLLLPNRADLMGLLGGLQRAHPEAEVHLELGALAPGAPGAALSLRL